jgi:hypothetical protein
VTGYSGRGQGLTGQSGPWRDRCPELYPIIPDGSGVLPTEAGSRAHTAGPHALAAVFGASKRPKTGGKRHPVRRVGRRRRPERQGLQAGWKVRV